MQSKMKNLETKVKGVSLVTMLVCVCGIIPILWIAKYNVIGLDDYSFGVMSHQAWKETKSVWKFIEAAFIATKDNYLNWQGSFTYNFLSHIYLAYIDEKFAWVTPVLMLSTLIFSLHYLYFCLIERFMIKKTKYAYIVFWVLIFGIIQEMPSAVEGYFWYGGAIGYTFLHSFYFCLVGVLIRVENERNKNIVRGILISIGAFFMGGSHYITALECAILFFLYIGFSLINKKTLCWWKWLAMVLFFIGFFAQIMAPGNAVRQEATVGMPMIKAISYSFLYAGWFGIRWISVLKIITIFLTTPWMWKLLEYSKIKFDIKSGILLFFISFCIYASCFTAPLYGVGNVNAGRIQNLIYIMLYIIFFIDYYYFLGILKKSRFSTVVSKHSVLYRNTCVCIISIGIIVVALNAASDKDKYVAVSALESLCSGEARTYYEEALERYELLNDETISEVKLHPYSVKPHVLFCGDIVEEGNEDFWINNAVQRYYMKEKVVLNVE